MKTKLNPDVVATILAALMILTVSIGIISLVTEKTSVQESKILGHDVYADFICPYCPFGTGSLESFRTHLESTHNKTLAEARMVRVPSN